jgi:hypothetical protein
MLITDNSTLIPPSFSPIFGQKLKFAFQIMLCGLVEVVDLKETSLVGL